MQVLKPPPPSWQSRVTPASRSEKPKVALVEVVWLGGLEVIVGVEGSAVSIVQP